jgi:hypothetical protein
MQSCQILITVVLPLGLATAGVLQASRRRIE